MCYLGDFFAPKTKLPNKGACGLCRIKCAFMQRTGGFVVFIRLFGSVLQQGLRIILNKF